MSRLKLSPDQIKDARAVLEAAPHLQLLHFTADGNYYVQAYPYKKEGETEQKLYGRVGLLHTAANKPEAIVDQFLIVKTYTREEMLAEGFTGEFPEPATEQPAAEAKSEPAPAVADLAAAQEQAPVAPEAHAPEGTPTEIHPSQQN